MVGIRVVYSTSVAGLCMPTHPKKASRRGGNLPGLAHYQGVDVTKLLGRLGPGETITHEPSFAQSCQQINSRGPVLYAIRLADRLIKIGWTSDLYGRWRQLVCTDHAEEFLAFTFGSRADETELHRRLTEHVARGNEYYHPHAEVLDVVNSWRAEFGRGPVS